jgi:predicted Zn-dependent peptidase
VLSTAISLADNTALYNDPNRINTEPQKQLAVTAEDIQKAAAKYLRTANRVVVETVPAGGPARPPAKQN